MDPKIILTPILTNVVFQCCVSSYPLHILSLIYCVIKRINMYN